MVGVADKSHTFTCSQGDFLGWAAIVPEKRVNLHLNPGELPG